MGYRDDGVCDDDVLEKGNFESKKAVGAFGVHLWLVCLLVVFPGHLQHPQIVLRSLARLVRTGHHPDPEAECQGQNVEW